MNSVFRLTGLSAAVASLLFFTCASFCRATSVVPPSFAELVREAEIIVRAKVKSVRSTWVDSVQGRIIKTYVTFDVHRQLKGPASTEITLQILGGEIDGQSMRIAGMPEFVIGQTEILFVGGNGVRFCPLIGMMHGRYRVQMDVNGREYVARNDGVPLESENDVQLPQAQGAVVGRLKSTTNALSVTAFEQKITGQVSLRATLP